LKSKSLPPVTVLASADAHKDFIAQDGTQIVGFYDAESEGRLISRSVYLMSHHFS